MDAIALKNLQTIHVACPFCDELDCTTLTTEFQGITGIVKCNNCKLIYTNPRIKEPEKFYFGEEPYYFDEAKLIFEGKQISHRWPNYLHDVKILKKYKKNGKLLDVGANMGFFAKIARDNNYEVHCVEPSKAVAKLAQKYFGLNVFNGFLEDFRSKEKFDIISMTDVFEHIVNPKELLLVCEKWLNDDGIMFIKVPHAKFSLLKEKLFRKRNPEKDIWDSYEHVVHYTQTTITKMLNAVGFTPVRFYVDPPVQLPNWHNYVGKYYQYPTPWFMDAKKKILRKMLYLISKLQFVLTGRLPSTAQVMVVVAKKSK